jgi:hypothetical protein
MPLRGVLVSVVAVVLLAGACGGGGTEAELVPDTSPPAPAVNPDGTVNSCGLVDVDAVEQLFGLELVAEIREDAPSTDRMADVSECEVSPPGETNRALVIRYQRFVDEARAAEFFEGDIEAWEGVEVEGPGDRAILIDDVELEVLESDEIVAFRFNPYELPPGDTYQLLVDFVSEALDRLAAEG